VLVVEYVSVLNTLINELNHYFAVSGTAPANLIPLVKHIDPDMLSDSLNALIKQINALLLTHSVSNGNLVKQFVGVTAPELTKAVNLLIEDMNTYTI